MMEVWCFFRRNPDMPGANRRNRSGWSRVVRFSLKLRHFPVMMDGGMEEAGNGGCIHKP